MVAARDRLPGAAREWPLLEADSSDPASLARLAGATRVVVTTVGPYARYGFAAGGGVCAGGDALRRPHR